MENNKERMKRLRIYIKNITMERNKLLKDQREYKVELNELKEENEKIK